MIWTDKPLVIDSDAATNPKQEERQWETQVYPLGNGHLGCTAFGDPKRERIQFNEESLWVGNEDSTGGYQPFGDVYIEMSHEEYSNYRRELDISRAIQTITYSSGGVNYKREYFSSNPAKVMVFNLSADKTEALSGKISMSNIHEIPVTADKNTLTMKGDTSNFWFWRLQLDNPERLIASREYTSPKNIDLDLEAQIRVLHDGGSVQTLDNTVVFENCNSITLLLAAGTNYQNQRDKGWRGEHPHKAVNARLSAAEKRSFSELVNEHISDYQRIYNRMSVDFGSSPAELTGRPTYERVRTYAEQFKINGLPADKDLEALLYQYARYLMISSSRPGDGALPANLQGIWLINRHPSWRCDFHTDINIQMNYWFTPASNLAECFLPFPEWVNSIREVRKDETRRVLGVKRGWLTRSENGIFGGSTWHFQKGDSAWLCQNLWDYYTFTQDEAYLEHYAYPVMKEISEFWIDHLKELPDGTLVAPDGRSPEHGPEKVDGVTYDQCLCWDLFTNTIDASAVLDVDDDYRKELIAKRQRLLGPQIGKWGQLQEWREDIDDPKDDHRHINHLIGLYPGHQIHPSTTPEFAKAAKIGLIARRDHGAGHPGWSRVWKACMFARLLDGDAAYGQLSETLATHIYPNLWAVHPPFQIDANFGYAAGVNEMLVQSHLGCEKSSVISHQSSEREGAKSSSQEPSAIASTRHSPPDTVLIHLLPALPKAWHVGSVRGLRVRGAFELDIQWKGGRLVSSTIRSLPNSQGKCTLQYGKQICVIEVPQGAEQTLNANDFAEKK